jgi:hypothetical protein
VTEHRPHTGIFVYFFAHLGWLGIYGLLGTCSRFRTYGLFSTGRGFGAGGLLGACGWSGACRLLGAWFTTWSFRDFVYFCHSAIPFQLSANLFDKPVLF